MPPSISPISFIHITHPSRMCIYPANRVHPSISFHQTISTVTHHLKSIPFVIHPSSITSIHQSFLPSIHLTISFVSLIPLSHPFIYTSHLFHLSISFISLQPSIHPSHPSITSLHLISSIYPSRLFHSYISVIHLTHPYILSHPSIPYIPSISILYIP